MANGVKDVYLLLSNASATGNAFTVQHGGKYRYTASATWGGGTVKLQILGPDGTTYIDIPSASLTANGSLVVELPCGATIKANVATSTAVFASVALID